jgi:gluconolactonase
MAAARMELTGQAIQRLDASLDAIVAADRAVEKLIEDHRAFFEGPVWVDAPDGGHLLFTDIAGDAILTWTPSGSVRTIASGFFESNPYARVRELDLGVRRVQLKGPDGLAIDRDGRIVYCGYGPRHVGRLEPGGRVTVLAECFGGRRLNTPNDIVVRSDGSIYFTDSSADTLSSSDDPAAGVPRSAVYRIIDGIIELLDSDYAAANGLAFSPDERGLYVNDTGRKRVWRYDVGADGRLGQRTLFIDMNSDSAEGVPDGMKLDALGNVYCTGPRGLWVISKDGTHLGTICTPERLTNLAFGGPDGTTLYITGPSFVWRIDLHVRGARPAEPLAPSIARGRPLRDRSRFGDIE